ncbi:hypothetical protein HPB50_028695 [Hyalomma asiaticum]|nr:hypothetical protein HPB50_028695 [Hyalomma asiaticum]
MVLILAGDLIKSVRRQTNKDPTARSNARGPNLLKQLCLGLAVQPRRLPCLSMPRATHADSGDARPQGQAVFGDSGVFAAFSMHETLVDHLEARMLEHGTSAEQSKVPHCCWRLYQVRAPTNQNARGPNLCKQLGLGVAVQRQCLPCLAMPRAENSDAEPQGLSDSGVSAAFSVHETLVDHTWRLGRLSMDLVLAQPMVCTDTVTRRPIRVGRVDCGSHRRARRSNSGHLSG